MNRFDVTNKTKLQAVKVGLGALTTASHLFGEETDGLRVVASVIGTGISVHYTNDVDEINGLEVVKALAEEFVAVSFTDLTLRMVREISRFG